MAKSISDNPKKGRGRPATGKDPMVGIRMSEDLQKEIRAWASNQVDQPRLAPAIRRLVEIGLTVKSKGRPESELPSERKATSRQLAGEMASNAIDAMFDATASLHDQASRKRRLVKGPEEFEKVRRDRNQK